MTNNEKQFAQILDWMEGRLTQEDAAAAEKLFTALPESEKLEMGWYKTFGKLSGTLRFAEMPEELRTSLLNVYSSPEKAPGLISQVIALLTFNSRAGLSLAGVRSAAREAQSHQLIFSTESCDITLNIEPDQQNFKIYGQVFWNESGVGEAVSAQLLGVRESAPVVPVDEFGEFEFTGLAAGEYEFVITSPTIEILIPGVIVEGP